MCLQVINQFDKEFQEQSDEIIFQTILAANFLDIKNLLELMCKKVADEIKKCKTPDDIRDRCPFLPHGCTPTALPRVLPAQVYALRLFLAFASFPSSAPSCPLLALWTPYLPFASWDNRSPGRRSLIRHRAGGDSSPLRVGTDMSPFPPLQEGAPPVGGAPGRSACQGAGAPHLGQEGILPDSGHVARR